MNYSYKIKKNSGTKSLYITFDSVEFRCFSFKNDEYDRTCLYIIGKNESYSNNFADYLLLYRKIIKEINDKDWAIKRVGEIIINSFNVKKEDINLLNIVSNIELDVFLRKKCYKFEKCIIEKETSFNESPISYLFINNSIITDLFSINGYSGIALYLDNNKIINYTGNIKLKCKKLVLNKNNLDLKLFFLKTIADETTELELFEDRLLNDADYRFISNFKNLSILKTWGVVEDCSSIDKLTKLDLCMIIGTREDRIKRKTGKSSKREDDNCLYKYYSLQYLYPEMLRLIEIPNNLKKEWENKILNYSYEKIEKDLYKINLFRKEIIEWAIKSPKENKLNEGFFDIEFQNRLETRDTALPFASEEGIKYIEPNMPILITDSISKEKPISYHKELFKKKY